MFNMEKFKYVYLLDSVKYFPRNFKRIITERILSKMFQESRMETDDISGEIDQLRMLIQEEEQKMLRYKVSNILFDLMDFL